MKSAHTVDQVRTAERALMARLPEGALMQRAAAGLATHVTRLLDGLYGARVGLLVGKGDNGGDALYAAARLAARGARVEAVLLGTPDSPALRAYRASGGRVVEHLAADCALVLDGITGIGGSGGLRPEALAHVRAVTARWWPSTCPAASTRTPAPCPATR